MPQSTIFQFGTEPPLPGFNQYCGELMCIAQGYNTLAHVGYRSQDLESEFDALPLRHRALHDTVRM